MESFMEEFKNINIEIKKDYGRREVVSERKDDGVRRGKIV